MTTPNSASPSGGGEPRVITPRDHYQRMLFLGLELGAHCRGAEHLDGPESLPWFLPTDWAQAWWCWAPDRGTYLPFVGGKPVRFGLEAAARTARPDGETP